MYDSTKQPASGARRVRGGAGGGGERVAGSPGPAAAAVSAGGGSSKLDPSSSNRKSSELTVAVLCPKQCRCRTCDKCGPVMGWRLRQNMLAKAHHFRTPAMLTLTVDRSRFASPEDAHRAISDGGYVRRLMRLLNLISWFWVLEFQTKTGDGWPHWHVLIDLEDVGGRVDLAKAWGLWRDRWRIGGLQLEVSKFKDPTHGVMYMTKYLTKMPEAFPLWVMVRERAIRFLGGCKSLGSLTGEPPRPRIEPEPVDQMTLPFRKPRTILVFRMARCEQTANVFCVAGDCAAGEGEWKWMGTIPATVDDVIELAEQGILSLRLAAVEWGEGELLAITDASVGGVVSALGKVPGELADRDVGYAAAWAQRMNDREWEVLDRHAGFWQRAGNTEAL